MARRILITGASGIIGRRLTRLLLEKGYGVAHLRHPSAGGNSSENKEVRAYSWDLALGTIDAGCIEKTDAIIHLAGAGVAEKKWTPQRKKEIIESRTKGLELLFKTLSFYDNGVKTVLSAGAIGFYGNRGEDLLTEDAGVGTGFLSESCKAWEDALFKASELKLRTAQLRIGVVLSRNGGALSPIANTAKFGLGSPLGNGKQWVSWIHVDDVCRAFIFLLEKEHSSGIYNAVAPNPVRNEELMRAVAKTLQRPFFLPAVPSFILHSLLGERAAVVLDSTRVSGEKLAHAGFEFQFKSIDRALADLYSTRN